MNLKNLFWVFIYFIVLNNYQPLLTQNIGTNTNLTNLVDARDEFITLTESTYNFLLRGYSKDEVMEALNDEQENTDKIAKLIATVQNLLDKQYSKNNIIDIVINNKEFNNFYAQKNFWAKIKNTYFVLNSTGILVIIIVVLYLLYALYKWFDFHFPWPRHKDIDPQKPDTDEPTLSNAGKSNTNQPAQTQPAQTQATQAQPAQTQPTQTQSAQAQLTQIQAAQATQAQPAQTQPTQAQSPQTQLVQAQPVQAKKTGQPTQDDENPDESYSPNFCEVSGSEIVDIDKIDFELRNSIAQQIAQARELGIDVTATQFNAVNSDTILRDTSPLGEVGERFLKLIEYAESIGLISQ